ncbi:hypothetical protein ACSDQ9_03085 [Aestuariimicrobium soli]|uniref:hypothetical protein n=1 Tax=Aestuariimicrobium soli TaxID=2035834 RepID=UPI003EB9532E
MISDQPDFRTIAQDYDDLSVEWQQKADELGAALAAHEAVEQTDTFTLTMLGPTQVRSLEFTDEAIETSPVQLRKAILEAVARLGVASANGQASAVARILDAPEIGQQMRESVPAEVREQARDESEDFEGHSRAQEQPPTPPDQLNFEEVMAWADEQADPHVIVSENLAEMMSDVEGWNPSYLGVDENQILEDLQREVQALVDGARDLPQRIERIEAEASSKYLTVVVNGAGRLVDLTFRPAFRNISADVLTQDFAEVYATAQGEAQQQLFAAIDGLTVADDPTTGLLSTPDQPTSPHQGE